MRKGDCPLDVNQEAGEYRGTNYTAMSVTEIQEMRQAYKKTQLIDEYSVAGSGYVESLTARY